MVRLTYQHVDNYFYPLDDEIHTVEVELTSPIDCVHETIEKQRQYPSKARSNLKLWKPEGLGFPNAPRSLPPKDLLGAKCQELLRFFLASKYYGPSPGLELHILVQVPGSSLDGMNPLSPLSAC
jgi:hypothetical protein